MNNKKINILFHKKILKMTLNQLINSQIDKVMIISLIINKKKKINSNNIIKKMNMKITKKII